MDYAAALDRVTAQEASTAASIALEMSQRSDDSIAANAQATIKALVDELQALRQKDSTEHRAAMESINASIAKAVEGILSSGGQKQMGVNTPPDAEEEVTTTSTEQQLEDLAAEHVRSVATFQQQLSALRGENSQLKAHIESMKEQYVHVSQVHALEAQLEQASVEIRAASATVDNQVSSTPLASEQGTTGRRLHAVPQNTPSSSASTPALSFLINESAVDDGSVDQRSQHSRITLQGFKELEARCTELGRAKEQLEAQTHELQAARRELTDAKAQAEQMSTELQRVRSDAQGLTYENGVLSQQFASLLVIHEFARKRLQAFSLDDSEASPSRRAAYATFKDKTQQKHLWEKDGDFSLSALTETDAAYEVLLTRPALNTSQLNAFGRSYATPDVSELTGVSGKALKGGNATAASAAVSSVAAVNVDPYSVDSVQDLVDRCKELSKQLWLAANPDEDGVQLGKKAKAERDDVSFASPVSQRHSGFKRPRDVEEEQQPVTPSVQRAVSRRDQGTNTDMSSFLLSRPNTSTTASSTAAVAASSESAPAPATSLATEVLASAFDNFIESTSAVATELANAHNASALGGSIEESETIHQLSAVAVEQEAVIDTLLQRQLQDEARIAALEQELTTLAPLASNTVLSDIRQLITQWQKLVSSQQQATTLSPATISTDNGSSSLAAQIEALAAKINDAASCLEVQQGTLSSLLELERSSGQQQEGYVSAPRGQFVSPPTRRSASASAGITDTITSLQQTISTLQQELTEKTDALEAERTDAIKTMDKLWQLEIEAKDAKEVASTFESRLAQMLDPALLTSAKEEIGRLQQRLTDSEQQLSNALRAHAEVATELTHTKESMTKQLQDAHIRGKEQHQRLEQLERESGEHQKEVATLNQVIQDGVKERQDIAEASAAKDALVVAAEEETRLIKTQVLASADARTVFKQLFPGDTATQLSLERLGVAESERVALSEKCRSLEETCKNQSAEIESLTTMLQKEHRDLQTRSAQMTVSELSHNEVLRQTSSEVEGLHATTHTLEAEASRLRSELAQYQVREAQLKEQISVLSSDPATENVRRYGVAMTKDIQAQMQEMAQRCAEQGSEISSLQTNVQRLESTVQSQTEQITSAQNELESLRAQLSTVSYEKSTLEQKVSQCEATIAELRSSLSEKQTTLTELQGTLSEREKALSLESAQRSALSEALEKEKATSATLQTSLSAAESANTQLTSTVSEKESQIQSTRADNERLLADNVNLSSDSQGLRERVKELHAKTQEQEKTIQLQRQAGGAAGRKTFGGGAGSPQGRHFSELVKKK